MLDFGPKTDAIAVVDVEELVDDDADDDDNARNELIQVERVNDADVVMVVKVVKGSTHMRVVEVRMQNVVIGVLEGRRRTAMTMRKAAEAPKANG